MINKTDLIERLSYASKWNTPVSAWIIDVIRNTPDAVTRCWNCRHCEQRDDKAYCGFLELYVEADTFCAWGKKK